MHRLLIATGIVVTSLALAGCSAIDIAYNNAPTFVGGEFDDAFDLDDEQAERLDDALHRFFAWHRQHELPRYRQLLQQAAVTVADGVSAAEFLQFRDDIRAAWRRAQARLIDEIGALAATLTPQQVDRFEQYYRDESEHYRDYLEMSAQQRAIFLEQRNLKRLQEWFGDFDDLQRERVQQRLQRLPELRSIWIRYREQRQQALLGAMRGDGGATPAQLKYILLDPGSAHARLLDAESAEYWRAYAQAIEDISRGLSKAQLTHAVDRLHYFTEIVEELIDET